MQRAAEVHARIGKAEELGDIVAAVRVMAAVRVRQADESAAAIATYRDVVAGALGQALSLIAVPLRFRALAQDSRLLVAVGSEHGFVAGFNDRLLDEVEAACSDARTMVAMVGDRAAAAAEERSIPLAWSMAMATHGGAIDGTARELYARVYESLEAASVARVDLLHVTRQAGRGVAIERRPLLPVNLASFAARDRAGPPPLHHLEPARLVEELARQYVLAELAQVIVESFASENRARLHTMDRAHHNIEDKLAELRALARRLRQEEITTEVVDAAVGARAVLESQGHPDAGAPGPEHGLHAV